MADPRITRRLDAIRRHAPGPVRRRSWSDPDRSFLSSAFHDVVEETRRRPWVAAAGAAAVGMTVAAAAVMLARRRSADRSGLRYRVATNLGVDPSDLDEAFARARRELQEERRNTMLNRLVQRGRITREQADRVSEWLGNRPMVVDDVMASFHQTRGYHRDLRRLPVELRPVMSLAHMPERRVEMLLRYITERGQISEGEAQEIRSWLKSRPRTAVDALINPPSGISRALRRLPIF